jgi:hypothetical protein
MLINQDIERCPLYGAAGSRAINNKQKEYNMDNSKRFWLVPPSIYNNLNSEFSFDFDPCPYPRPKKFNGITVPWGRVNWVNPPFRRADAAFGAGPTAFIRKAIEEQKKGNTSVIIINTMSFINLLIEAGAEVRSMGRVRWLDCRTGEPWTHPSNTTLFILRGDGHPR